MRQNRAAVQPHFEDWANPNGATLDPAAKAATAEYETEVHFRKCYGVMAELFELHNNLEDVIPSSGFKFLDLGCAPGGFSSYLLDDPRCFTGFGVTLPSTSGGFPMRLRRPNFMLQQGDLFEIGLNDLLASDVNVCICDAQYMRNNVAWDDEYKGVRCRSKQHGVWALLLKQLWLGLSRLTSGGILIFRFGWRDPGPHDPATVWYKRMTTRLFTLLHDLFEEVREVKSDYFNALQSSFYVCCSNFDAERFANREVAKLFGNNFNYLLSTFIQDSNELDIFPQVDKIRTEQVDENISAMLDRINKLRLVHQQSRRVHEQKEYSQEDPKAAVVLRPVPGNTSDDSLCSTFSVYGRLIRITRDGEHEVSVQFANICHARAAVAALRGSGAFSDVIKIWMREEVEEWSGAVEGVEDQAHSNGATGPFQTEAPSWPGSKGKGNKGGKGREKGGGGYEGGEERRGEGGKAREKGGEDGKGRRQRGGKPLGKAQRSGGQEAAADAGGGPERGRRKAEEKGSRHQWTARAQAATGSDGGNPAETGTT